MNEVGADGLIGSVLDGRYTILERIATGGMASVYRAVDTRLDRDVAIKVMRPHLAHDESFVSRFRREARSAARLSHPNIVSVFDQGEDDRRIFLVMEYVPGRTLREVIDDEGALSPRAAIDIMDRVLAALGEAHAHSIVHRDVKPENVIIRDDGAVKVADFGLARATTAETATSATTEVLGTLSYISPEQVEGNAVSPRSDVYAAGLILSEMLTGTKVFVGDSIPNVLFQHLNKEVPPPSRLAPGVPPSLDSLVLDAVAKDPDDRPADATEFRTELRHVRERLSDSVLDRRTGPSAPDAAGPANATQVIPGPSVSPDAPTQALTQPRAAATPTPRPAAAPGRASAAPAGASAIGAAADAPGPHHDTDPAVPRSRRGLLAALIALLLAGAAGAGWYFQAGPGSPTTVPQLVNLTRDAAHEALGSAHLEAKDVEAFSETVAQGSVISATPGEGAELGRGDTVTLTVSKGKERYAVPELIDVPRKTATARLAKANLEAGTVTEEYSETVDAGRVLSADPPAGTELKRGAPVNLVISAGPEPIDVPDLLGLTLQEARELADDSGLVLEEGDEVYSTEYDKGTVAVQDPAEGTLQRGETVTISLSKGPELVEVPSCFNLSEADAVALLERAGFTVKVDRFLGAPLDRCTGQSPAGGAEAPKGSTVTITIV